MVNGFTEHFALMADARSVETGTSANALVERNIAEETHPDAGWRGVADTHLANAKHTAAVVDAVVHKGDSYFDSLVKLFLRHRWFIEEIARTPCYLAMNDTWYGRETYSTYCTIIINYLSSCGKQFSAEKIEMLYNFCIQCALSSGNGSALPGIFWGKVRSLHKRVAPNFYDCKNAYLFASLYKEKDAEYIKSFYDYYFPSPNE